ncbi:MAG: hypothetical protein CHACPFDD_00977 [Phycisphaerae bacterium]|nr:hypothetical protein [Phycisphaerae bacterium]
MFNQIIDVLLITDDAALAADVQRTRPADLTLRVLPADARPGDIQPRQIWMDRSRRGAFPDLHPQRWVYFTAARHAVPANWPIGPVVRKPCAAPVLEILWADLVASAADVPRPPANLPEWLLEFHDADLRALCRKCTTILPERLGYSDASIYLHDAPRGQLTLAETNHVRPINLVIPLATDGILARAASQARMQLSDDASPIHVEYRDGRYLVAPCTADNQVVAVIGLSRVREQRPDHSAADHERVFAFIGRSLRLARQLESARTEARVDELSGIANVRAFREALAGEISRATRFSQPLSLLMLDLDGLKAVNDRLGHPAGDVVIRDVAGRISSALRQFDVCARVGGDEFAVLLPSTDLAGARRAALRIQERIASEPAPIDGHRIELAASIGAVQRERGWDGEKLVRAADEAMYRAKRAGGARICFRPPAGAVGDAAFDERRVADGVPRCADLAGRES